MGFICSIGVQTWTLWTKVGDWTGKPTEKLQDVSLRFPTNPGFQMFRIIFPIIFPGPPMTPKSAPGEGSGITTEIVAASNFHGPLVPFYYAEDYHQQYLAKPGARPYCSAQPQRVLWQIWTSCCASKPSSPTTCQEKYGKLVR